MNTSAAIRQIERISKALSDPCRIEIMEAIQKQGDWMQCSAIVEMVDLAQSTVSHHMKQLVDADLVIIEKDGRYSKYKINKEVFSSYINFLKRYE